MENDEWIEYNAIDDKAQVSIKVKKPSISNDNWNEGLESLVKAITNEVMGDLHLSRASISTLVRISSMHAGQLVEKLKLFGND